MIRTWIVIVVSIALMAFGWDIVRKNRYPWSVGLGIIIAIIGALIMLYNMRILFIA